MGIPPTPLAANEVAEVFAGLETADDEEEAAALIHLLTHRVPPGVDEAAQTKVDPPGRAGPAGDGVG